MTFLSILLNLYIFLQTLSASNVDERLRDRIQTHNELNRELRNAICCMNKMRCCKTLSKPANIEIRAVLARCPNTACEGSDLTRRCEKPIYSTIEHDVKFQDFDKDEPLSQSSITNCRKKLLLTIKISGGASKSLKNEYIVVDHVYDPDTKKSTRVLTPYVIKLKQNPITQMYGLKFLHVVNSHAREEVYNKHGANYTGCDTTSNNPICGKIAYNGKMIPYSQGFCCSCDALKNTNRQPKFLNQYAESDIRYSNPAYFVDGIECSRLLKGMDNIRRDETNNTGEAKFETVFPETIPENNANNFDNYNSKLFADQNPKVEPTQIYNKKVSSQTPNRIDNPSNPAWNEFGHNGHPNFVKQEPQVNQNLQEGLLNDQAQKYFSILNDVIKNKNSNELNNQIKNLETVLRSKRQMLSSGAQRRGGQNCADIYTPKGHNPETYHESTHCLRFSDLWYTVYRLDPPIIENSVLIELFEKHEDMDGHIIWRDITKGKMINVGTMKNQYTDEKNTISVKYSSDLQETDPSKYSLNYKSTLLMIPEGVKNCDVKKHPEIKGGPPEYLVAHASQVSLDGNQCNVAGVGLEAFAKQPNRCFRPRGSCLANQPYQLWKHDHDAEKLGRKGCFFLKHFGKLPNDPIRKNPKTGDQYLVLEYEGSYSNVIDLELKADFNTILQPQSSAQITEVYVDSASPSNTILTVKITNSGLTSSSFVARLTDCPLEIPASFNNIQSKPVLIPPQHQHVFQLSIKCALPADRFYCSVEALNSNGELVALRRIRLQKFDRCICTWHCLCACVGSTEGLKCIPMSLQHYHAAGFQGSLPVTSYVVHYTFFDDVLSLIMYILLFLILTIFVLGLCKALIGIVCCPAVGLWGLDVILDLPHPMEKYYEKDLYSRAVLYDQEGWPVHPETQEKVRSISRSTEFCINLFFFFTYPFNILLLLLRRICCPSFDETDTGQSCYDGDSVCKKSKKRTRKQSVNFRGKRKIKRSISSDGSFITTESSEDVKGSSTVEEEYETTAHEPDETESENDESHKRQSSTEISQTDHSEN